MPSAIKWEQPWVSRGTVLGAQLDGLLANARSAAGTELDNSVNLDQWGKFELVLAAMSGAPPPAPMPRSTQ